MPPSRRRTRGRSRTGVAVGQALTSVQSPSSAWYAVVLLLLTAGCSGDDDSHPCAGIAGTVIMPSGIVVLDDVADAHECIGLLPEDADGRLTVRHHRVADPTSGREVHAVTWFEHPDGCEQLGGEFQELTNKIGVVERRCEIGR